MGVWEGMSSGAKQADGGCHLTQVLQRQERIPVTEVDCAWLAGFFDGEGCIIGVFSKRKGYHLLVSIGQKDERPLLWIKRRFGGWIERGKEGGRVHMWRTSHANARAFLEAIAPYLRVKKERAELALSIHPEALSKIPNAWPSLPF